nr:MAG: hypothetical protein TU35_09200 [Thermoproteus sp. AZ2]
MNCAIFDELMSMAAFWHGSGDGGGAMPAACWDWATAVATATAAPAKLYAVEVSVGAAGHVKLARAWPPGGIDAATPEGEHPAAVILPSHHPVPLFVASATSNAPLEVGVAYADNSIGPSYSGTTAFLPSMETRYAVAEAPRSPQGAVADVAGGARDAL